MSLMWDINDRDVYMNYLPWHHSFGQAVRAVHDALQRLRAVPGRFAARTSIACSRTGRSTTHSVFFSVPASRPARESLQRGGRSLKLVFGGRLRCVFSAGCALPAHVEAAYRSHGIPVLEAGA
jgi:long-subunit acyl-CoA synthetase (AMP-forming)